MKSEKYYYVSPSAAFFFVEDMIEGGQNVYTLSHYYRVNRKMWEVPRWQHSLYLFYYRRETVLTHTCPMFALCWYRIYRDDINCIKGVHSRSRLWICNTKRFFNKKIFSFIFRICINVLKAAFRLDFPLILRLTVTKACVSLERVCVHVGRGINRQSAGNTRMNNGTSWLLSFASHFR